jgi:DNA-binding MarR family transcriptional regulator
MKREETVDFHIRSAWHAIARMYNQQASQYDATMSVGFALLVIDSEEGTPATKIAPMMGLEVRSLTRILKSLEEKKLITRVSDKSDKRSVRICLTKKGKEKRELAKETVVRFNEMVKTEISQTKLDVFFEVIQQINKLAERSNSYEKQLAN